MAAFQQVTRRIEDRIAGRRMSDTARAVRARRLTYLSPVKLLQLERALDLLERDRVHGDFVECGIALGGSAALIAKAATDQGRSFDGYDVFGIIPEPTEHDPPAVHERYRTIVSGASKGIGDDIYYGYRDDLYEHVIGVLTSFGVPVGDRARLHRGYFEDTLHPTAPIAFAHIDCDWYEPVRLCLERVIAHLAVGGMIIIDDYHDYEGARRATDEVLEAHPMLAVVVDHGHVVLRRKF